MSEDEMIKAQRHGVTFFPKITVSSRDRASSVSFLLKEGNMFSLKTCCLRHQDERCLDTDPVFFVFFFHFTLMMLFRALIPRTLLRSQHSSTVGRPWVGATKDIVFSLRQTWVQMPTLPLISLWDWASSVISLVFSFLVFKIELATCVSKFARLKWA